MATKAVAAPSLSHISGFCTLELRLQVVHLHNEQPSPTCQTANPVHSCENTGGDQSRETGRENLRAVKQCDACSDLCKVSVSSPLKDNEFLIIPLRV